MLLEAPETKRPTEGISRKGISDVTDVTVGGFLIRTAPDVMVQLQQTFSETPSFPTADTINGWERD
jgi:hypothetical protein